VAEPANLGTAARLIPLPIRDPNRPIAADAGAGRAEPRPARPGPDGFAAPALPGANPLLTNGQRIRPGAPGADPDRPRNPGDIGAAPRLEQRPRAPLAQAPDARPFAQVQDQRFDPPQRLLDLLDAQRGRDVAAELTRQTREAIFGAAPAEEAPETAAATSPVEPGPDVEFRPAADERPAFQRIADLAAAFNAQDARRVFAAAQAESALTADLPAGQPARQHILIDQRV